MEAFKISDIQELFERDLEQFYSTTRMQLKRLLSEPSPTDALEDAKRQAHSLKGLAATVHAWGLSCWGADLERLLQLAESVFETDRNRANTVFTFIQDHLEDWYVMNQFSVLNALPEAWQHYCGLRKLMERKWRGCLAEINPAALAELNPEAPMPAGNGAPDGDLHAARPMPLDLKSPVLQRMDPPATQEQPAPVDGQVAFSALHPAPPTPLDLKAPALQRLEEPNMPHPAQPAPLDLKAPALRRLEEPVSTVVSEAVASISPELNSGTPASSRVLHPARPKPLNLLPPKLRKKGTPESVTTSEAQRIAAAPTAQPPVTYSVSVSPAPTLPLTAPPIVEVAPPPLQRRDQERTAEAAQVPSAAAESAPAAESKSGAGSAQQDGTTAQVQPIGDAPAAQPAITYSVTPSLPPAAPPIVEVTPPPLKRREPDQAVETAKDIVPLVGAGSAPVESKSGAQEDFLDMLVREVAGYLEELSANLLRLAAQLGDQSSWECARRLFHTIKGTAATFHLDAVSVPAKAAEARCIIAIEDAKARTSEAFGICVQHAQAVARALHLSFDEKPIVAVLAESAQEEQRKPEAKRDIVSAQPPVTYSVSVSATPTLPPGQVPVAAPPIVEVTPPPLKRRGKKQMGETAQDMVPSSGAESAPAAENKSDAQEDFLDMLGLEVAGYLEELEASLLRLAVKLDDQSIWESARRLFHTIKGTAATFHLDAVSVPAKAAEARCIVAIEDAKARTSEAFEICLQHAQAVAGALHLSFAEEPIRAALAESAEQLRFAAEASTQAPVDPEMAGFFIRDANDQIAAIEQAALRWEKGENPGEQVWAAQRGFHTLKGAANSIGLSAVARSVHEAEEFLEGVAATNAPGTRPLFIFLFAAVDQLRDYLRRLTANTAALWHHDWKQTLQAISQPAIPDGAKPDSAGAENVAAVLAASAAKLDAADNDSQTLRIQASRLYQLVNLIGELVIDRKRVEIKIKQLSESRRALQERNTSLQELVQNFQHHFEFSLPGNRAQGRSSGSPGVHGAAQPRLPGRSSSDEFSELEFDRYDQFNVLARSLVEISHDIEQLNEEMDNCLHAFEAENAQFQHTSDQLQHQVTDLTMVPANSVFPRLKRVFRDALQVEQKDADLIVDGGEVMLDKVVMDRIYAPLMHLLRNAVAHGIEDPATREALKKPARGVVRLSTAQVSNQIVITLCDDGAGLRADAIRQRAIDKGWLAADAPALTDAQVVDFIFRPGFSTAVKVTSVSGRGVGLDVVRKEIEELNGSVELKSESNKGSTWTLRLPLTLSISEAILTEVGDLTFAFPLNFVEAGIILDSPAAKDGAGRETYLVGESPLPLVRLSEVLQMPGHSTAANGLILSVGDRRAVVAVDRVRVRQEIVNKQLDSLTAGHPLLNGATLDVDGHVIPILNLPALLKFSERSRGTGPAGLPPVAEAPSDNGEFRVLIVDDSLSVRKVQERFLRDLGCCVTAATDGLQALEKLRKEKFDVVFTDLEMPRLNGYELIAELRGNPAWSSLPVVVISSRGTDKHITKAMNLGATTFLSKPFTAEQLEQVLRHYGNWDAAARTRLEEALPV